MKALRHLSSTCLRAPRCLVIYVLLPITSHIMIEIGRQRLPRLTEWSLAGYTVPRDRDNQGRRVARDRRCLQRTIRLVPYGPLFKTGVAAR